MTTTATILTTVAVGIVAVAGIAFSQSALRSASTPTTVNIPSAKPHKDDLPIIPKWKPADPVETFKVITTITAPVKFDKYDQHRALVVPDGTRHSMWIRWSYQDPEKPQEDMAYPFTLNPSETCTFTIEEKRVPRKAPLDEQVQKPLVAIPAKDYFSDPILVRVVRDGKVIYDREVCEIHHRSMEYKEVPIIYGLMMSVGKQPTREEVRTLFPYSSENGYGGCCLMPERTTFVFFCPDCKTAYAKWERATTSPAEQSPFRRKGFK